MKRIVFLISTALVITLLAGACKSSNKCAAYGEVQKYQKESKY